MPYNEAFHEMNKRRQFGMAELPLLGSEIYLYGKMHYFDTDMEFFYKAMTGMDDEYMLHLVKLRKEEQKGKEKPTGKP